MTDIFLPDVLLNQCEWTIDQYHQMIAAGVLREDDRVELLFGKIVNRSPVGKVHAAGVKKLNQYFIRNFDRKVMVGVQDPVILSDYSEPEPDLSIMTYQEDNYVNGLPRTADIILIIEVSDQTLRYDRNVKGAAYAQSGVREYWIVNLIDRQVEQYLAPDQRENRYTQLRKWSPGESFTSQFFGEVRVDELLP